MRQTAIVIVEDDGGRVAMQLRDNIPTIQSPNMWGLFGGAVEVGEVPRAAAKRELTEELALNMVDERLELWRSFVLEAIARELFVFWYRVNSAEKATLHLNEGQRFAFVPPAQVDAGTIDGYKINQYHQQFIQQFYEQPDKANSH